MADTVRERIMVAMLAALAAAFPSARVERNRDRPAEADARPYIILLDGGQTPDRERETQRTWYDMRPVVEGITAASDDGAAVGATLNAMYGAALAALVGSAEVRALADVYEGELNVELDHQTVQRGGVFELNLSVEFRTLSDDPTALG